MDTVKVNINPDLIIPPFTFNPLKHHLGFIRELIKTAEGGADEKEIFRQINMIGPQLTDIYGGNYSLDQLLEEIKSKLIQLSSFEKNYYEAWVENSGKHYNLLELPDGSKWTFRKGEKKGRYIHFHPARMSCSVRVRGTTLRTALALKILAKGNTDLYRDSDFINEIRKNKLELSPVKNIRNFTALKKVLYLLEG